MKLPPDRNAPLPRLAPSPAALGFRMPAEWESHESVWLAWPHHPVTWPGAHLQAVEETYVRMIAVLLEGEKVDLLVRDGSEEDRALSLLKKGGVNAKGLRLHRAPTVDAWIRDYGPTFLKKGAGEKVWCKWRFNAWGGKSEPHLHDNDVFEIHSDLIPFKRFKADIVLEGGSIESNGAGTLLVTEQCLLNKNRNPGMSRTDIEKSLRDYLGVTNIVWLGEGLQGDDTDGHIDNLARFVNPTTVLALTEEDGAEANYAALKDNWERLVRSRDQNGKQWNLVKMPAPGSVMEGGRRLAASYVNFYIANRAVLVPTFGHRNDTRAIDILKDCFPEREIAAIPCRDLAVGGGSIHCVTQQEPA